MKAGKVAPSPDDGSSFKFAWPLMTDRPAQFRWVKDALREPQRSYIPQAQVFTFALQFRPAICRRLEVHSILILYRLIDRELMSAEPNSCKSCSGRIIVVQRLLHGQQITHSKLVLCCKIFWNEVSKPPIKVIKAMVLSSIPRMCCLFQDHCICEDAVVVCSPAPCNMPDQSCSGPVSES